MEFEEVTHTNVVILPKQDGPKLVWYLAKKTISLIRKKFWLVLLFMTAAFAGTFVVNEIRTPLYEASGTYALERPESAGNALTEAAYLDESASAERILKALTSTSMLARLRDDEPLTAILKSELTATPEPQKRFAAAIQAEYDAGMRHFVVVARDPNPDLARVLIERLVAVYNGTLPAPELLQNASEALKERRLAALSRFKNGESSRSAAAPLQAEFHETATARSRSAPIENPLPTVLTKIAPSLPSENSAAPPFRDTELNSQIAVLSSRIAALQRILANPSAADLASVGGEVRSAYQAISTARAKLQNAISHYQIPPDEKRKLEGSIASSQSRFMQTARNALATEQTRRRELESERGSPVAVPVNPNFLTAQAVPQPAAPAIVADSGINHVLAPAPSNASSQKNPASLNQTAAKFDEASFDAAMPLWRSLSSDGAVLPIRLTALREPKSPNRPLLPNKTGNLLLALLCGFALGCVAAAFIGFQDEAIIAPADIEREFLVPVLGLIAKTR